MFGLGFLRGLGLIFCSFIYSFLVYSKSCDLTMTLGSGGRDRCELSEVRVERDGYQHCKHYHWDKILEADKNLGQLERSILDKQITLKTCLTDFDIY
jgi:hypothetical protein